MDRKEQLTWMVTGLGGGVGAFAGGLIGSSSPTLGKALIASLVVGVILGVVTFVVCRRIRPKGKRRSQAAIHTLIIYSVLFVIGLSSEYKTFINLRYLITYPRSEVHDLNRGIIRVQEDTPLFIARGIVANDISKLEEDIRDSGFESSEYSRLFTLLVLYETGQYWQEGIELIDRALQEAQEDAVTIKIARNMEEYFDSGLMEATPPSLARDIGTLFRQSAVLLALIVMTSMYCVVSLKRSNVTARQSIYLKRGGLFLVLSFFGLIYLRLFY